MAGFCSKHQIYATKCKLCNKSIAALGDKVGDVPISIIKNHYEWYVTLIDMVLGQARSIHKQHNTMETYALVHNLENVKNRFTGEYD
jgi:hypothetical protein